MSKYIFLDFNGTIIDDVDLCLDLLNDILRNQNKKLVTKEQYKNIFTFPVKKYYELAGVDFSIESFESLADKFISAYQPLSLKCNLYPNSICAFQSLQKKGYHLVILSASEKNNLLEQCESFGIVPYFDAILGIDNIHAASKVGIALSYMKEQGIQGEDVLFVGDTLHDLEVAKAMGADCMLVSCGHQSTEVLKQGGVPILSSVYDLVDMMNEVN
ncbi:MAG: HAD hydrolase-like protein [Anaeroplasmataceae bacterium]|nr:HAD hydrolase-like protein [Anaeroplasmataceae bacterium]